MVQGAVQFKAKRCLGNPGRFKQLTKQSFISLDGEIVES